MKNRISISKLIVAAFLVTQHVSPARAEDSSGSLTGEDKGRSGPLPGEGKGHFIPMSPGVRNFSIELLQHTDALTHEVLARAKALTCPLRSQLNRIPDIALGLKIEVHNQPDYSTTDYATDIDLAGKTWVRFARRADNLAKMHVVWKQAAHPLETIFVQTAGDDWSWKPENAPEIASLPDRLRGSYHIFVTYPQVKPDERSPVVTCLYPRGTQHGIVAEIKSIALHLDAKNTPNSFEKTAQLGELTNFDPAIMDGNTQKRGSIDVDKSTLYAQAEYDFTANPTAIKSITFSVRTSTDHGFRDASAIRRMVSTGEDLFADGDIRGGEHLYGKAGYAAWQKPSPPDANAGVAIPVARNVPH